MLIWSASEFQLRTIYLLSVAPQCIQGNFSKAKIILTDLQLGAESYANFTLYYYLVLFLLPIILRLLYF